MLEIQKYLRSGKSLADLREEYGIKHNRHAEFPELVGLKYSQIDSPMGEKICQECRGIILNENDDWNIVARPFDKFFNIQQGHAAKIDWNTARVQRKMDGSLMFAYFYGGKWNVSSSGMPDAAGQVYGFGMTFADLFWEAWKGVNGGIENQRQFTFIFELTSKYNRIVVSHDEPKLTLLGVRSIVTGQESDARMFCEMFPIVPHHSLTSIEDVLATFDTMDPLAQEGYVIVDNDYNRVKVKHPGYVAIHHVISSVSPKAFLEIVRSGESSEVVSHFPEHADMFRDINERYSDLISNLEGSYRVLQRIEDQREFAAYAKESRHPATLFQLRKGRVQTVREALKSINIKQLMTLIGLKEKKG